MSVVTTIKDVKAIDVGGLGDDGLDSTDFKMTETLDTQIYPERRQNLRKLERGRYEMTKRIEDYNKDEDIDEKYEKFVMDQLLAKGDPYAHMVVNMKLRELDVNFDYLDDFVVAMFGRRRLGKTFGARWLCYQLRHRFPLVIVITNTTINGFWERYVPKDFIFTVPEMDEVFKKLYDRQEFILTHPQYKIDPRVLLILDDVLEDQMILQYSKYLKASFTDGRHYKISIMILLQYAKGITPVLRGNADIAIIYRQFQKMQRESLVEDFLDVLPTKIMAFAMLDKFTKCKGDPAFDKPEDIVRQALCVCPSTLSIAPENLCRTYNAKNPDKIDPKWKLGIDIFYQAARKGNMAMITNTLKKPKPASSQKSKPK